jgi:hypothetical protein
MALAELPRLADFLLPFATSGFGEEFAKPFHDVLMRLRRELIQDAPAA